MCVKMFGAVVAPFYTFYFFAVRLNGLVLWICFKRSQHSRIKTTYNN